MSTALITAIEARLTAGGLTVLADIAPTGPYVEVLDGAGTAVTERYVDAYQRRAATVRVMCVSGRGGTAQAVRSLAVDVSALLVGWVPLPGAEPIHETMTGPILQDGPEQDRRYSVTVEYQTHIRR